MAVPTPNPAQLYALLKWIGAGVAAGATVVTGTFVRNWITNKMHDYEDRKKAHLEELKEKVLSPIREGLSHNFGAVVSRQAPLLAVQGATVEFHERAKVTEEPAEGGEVLVAPFPTHKVFGSIRSALLEDARKNHFPELMSKIDDFLSRWGAYLGLWHVWASGISREILRHSGLDAFPPKPVPSTFRFYVMHLRLALFVYNRLAGFVTPGLAVQEQGGVWALSGMNYTLALGSREQMDALIVLLDKLLETERLRTAELRNKAAAFQEEFGNICGELDYAIASRRPRGRCDLVTFF